MKRRCPPVEPSVGDIVLENLGHIVQIEDLDLPEPIDLAHQLHELTGKHDAAEISAAQVKKLWSYGQKVAQHRRPHLTALVVTDDFLRTLIIVIEPKASLHFAFFTNTN